jgi:hypothetical protein
MKFRSYPLNGKLFEEQNPSAKIYAKKEFANESDDLRTVRRRMRIFSGVNEWVIRDPYRQSPSKEGNISGERGIDVRDMNDTDNGLSKMITYLYRAPSQSM